MFKQKIQRIFALVLTICLVFGFVQGVQAAVPLTLTVKNPTKLTYNSVQLNASCKYTTRPSEVGIYVGTSQNNLSKRDSDRITHRKNPFDIWYNLSGLNEGTTYYYQLYAIVRGRTYKSGIYNFTTLQNTSVAPRLTVKNPTKLTSNSVQVNASCEYRVRPSEVGIYVGTSRENLPDKGYDRINHYKNPFDIWYNLAGLKSGTTYYYQIYAVVNNREYRSGIFEFTTLGQNTSASMPINTSQLVEKGENASKRQFLFGNGNKRRFANRSEAEENMVSVTVPVWKLSNGKKVSSQITFRVHHAVAIDVRAIFNEIYNDPEQFPLHTVMGYCWRGNTAKGEHNCGTAIDINPDQNCQIRNGEIETGKLWSPGINSYSIPENGSVVRIFAKHGWSWGGKDWAGHTDWRYGYHDYMHFSYMGG